MRGLVWLGGDRSMMDDLGGIGVKKVEGVVCVEEEREWCQRC
jgi:hypothetical protein